MSNKHTPEPWTVRGRKVYSFEGEIEYTVAEVYNMPSEIARGGLANARLIAAAPHMYELLDILRHQNNELAERAAALIYEINYGKV